ncbi:MAG: mechanosensitive ion channel family protein [Rhodobacteraceae bacterium]|nr:mechanosensitive ion channel family protein [Paracoccaceae bacterium]
MFRAVARTARIWLLALLLFTVPLAALAQGLTDDDYTAWSEMVGRADRVLDAGRATEPTLLRLRGEVAKFRDRFLDAENANSARISRAQRQLDTLGPAPAEGQTEPEEVASRRAALLKEIGDLKAPSLRATEAFVQADALVAEIDKVLREQQASKVLQRYPVPLNPLNWTPVLSEVNGAFLKLPREVMENLKDAGRRGDVISQLPASVLLLLAGTFMVFRTRYWTDRLAKVIDAIRRRPLRRGLRLLIVISQLALPLLGLLLLLAAVQFSRILGDTGDKVILAVGSFGLMMITSTWLVRQIFPRGRAEAVPLRIAPEYVRRARRLSYVLAGIMAFHHGVDSLNQSLGFSPQTSAYLGFALGIVAAVVLYRIARLYRLSQHQGEDVADESAFSSGVISVVAALTQALCVVTVLAGAVGYVALSKHLVYPAIATFFLFGLMTLIQRAVSEFYAIATTGDIAAPGEEGLFPTLFGALLMFASLPVIALMWGARWTDLTEVWSRVREGFQVGDLRLSPSEFVIFLAVFLLGYGITRLIQGALKTTILPKTHLDTGARTALVAGTGYVGVFLAGVAAITMAGIDMSSLAIFASALAVGIGFGLQTIVSNFVSGIILLVERPISEGDWIEVGGQMGYVRKISVRATVVETFDRTDVIVPNADLVSGVVTNWTHGNLIGRVIVPVGVAYGTDTRKVERILMEIAKAHPLVVISPQPTVIFTGFGASSLDFEIRAILRDVNYVLSVKSDMNHEIARRFSEEDIEIPFPQRDLWVRNASELRPHQPDTGPRPMAPESERVPDIDA